MRDEQCNSRMKNTLIKEHAGGEPAKLINLERTGRVHSIASSEFEATYSDGTRRTVWSPVWHDDPPELEFEKAKAYARTFETL